MGVVTAGFFSTTTLALAPSLMLGFAAAASTAEVSCFTTDAGIVALTTEEVLVIVLMVFSFKTFIKKDSSGSTASHRINFDLFVAAMGLM
jgi:peroxiredoxin family protein